MVRARLAGNGGSIISGHMRLIPAGVVLLSSLAGLAAGQGPPSQMAVPQARSSQPGLTKPAQRPAPAVPAVPRLSVMAASDQTAVVAQYCATCHSERGKAGGLSLVAWTPDI